VSRLLKDWIEGFLKYTEEDEPCELYRKWVAISSIAAALQRKCYHKVGKKIFYPNFYIALVGPSGSRKNTAIDIEKDFLTELGVELAPNITSKEALIKTMADLGKREEVGSPFMSVRDQGFDMPVQPHASLTAIAQELVTFFPSGDSDFPAVLVELFDCLPNFKKRTLMRGDETIENVYLNLIGGIIPQNLKRRLTDEVEAVGLHGRFIFVTSFAPVKRNAYQLTTPEDQKLRRSLIRDLGDILSIAGPFKPTEGWLDKFTPWYELIDINPPPHLPEQQFGPYLSRRGAYIHKLSMISSASRGSNLTLTAHDFDRALATLEEAEKTMPDALSGIGASDTGRLLDDVLIFLKSTDKIGFNSLLRRFMYSITGEELLRIVTTLRDVGKVKMTKVVTEDESGKRKEELIIRYIREGERSN